MPEPLDDLAKIAAQLKRNEKQRDKLLVERNRVILEARAAGNTWRSIALILGMTEHGVIKAVKAQSEKDA